jgi:hypothetical protein
MERRRIPALAIVTLAFLIGFGIGLVSWSAGNRINSSYERAVDQARYLARQGIMERGLTYLRSLKPSELPTHRVDLQSGSVGNIGTYQNVYLVPDPESAPNRKGCYLPSFTIFATGILKYVSDTGESVVISRTESANMRIATFASYQYITDVELSIYGGYVAFWHADTLFGRVHSNDRISIMENPVFYGLVTTCQEDFFHGPGYNPNFVNYDPQFNVPVVHFPNTATQVRNCAAASGLTFDGEDLYVHKLVFDGQNGISVYKYVIGCPSGDSLIWSGAPIFDQSMFFYGPLDMKGNVFGRVTVGCSSDIRLLDDIKYEDSGLNGSLNPNTTNMLGIISEGNIIVADTWENGRQNSRNGSNIVINAAMLALGESFTFEDQNNLWEIYQGPIPDERGSIYLWGSVAQKRRGYVHRSNHGGTGYGKQYHIDPRFDRQAPPCYPVATNQMGYSIFNVESQATE